MMKRSIRRSARLATKGAMQLQPPEANRSNLQAGKRSASTGRTKNAAIKKSKLEGPTLDLEVDLWSKGFKAIAGVDEAGRGPLAGPVVAAACVLTPHFDIQGVSDSKKIPEARRLQLFKELVASNQLVYATCIVDSRTIDEINILQATFKAMEGAVAGLPLPVPDFTLVDGNMLPKAFHPEKSMAIVAGDATCMSISVASIIAKVTRDNLMFEYDRRWPDYGFAKHKGYPTREHICAINRLGPCEIHRMSYAPLQKQASESPEYIE